MTIIRTFLVLLATVLAPAFADETSCRYCYQDGVDARQRGELASALRFFMRGCERDDGASCHEASIMLSNGQGVPEDDTRAVSIGIRGCDLDYWKSCNAVGLALINARNPELATKGRELLGRACDGGWQTACETVEGLAKATREEHAGESDFQAKTTVGSMQVGQGDETATLNNVRASCGMLQLTLAFSVAAPSIRQCLGTSDTRRVRLLIENGHVTSSSVEPDDSVGRCVVGALDRARIESLTCRLEADVSR